VSAESSAATASATAKRAFRPNRWARAGWIALALYVVYAVSLFDISWARFLTGLDNGARFVARMLPPNFVRWEILLKGLTESIEIAVLASTLGILASLPLGLLAARNLMPWWVTWPARLFIALCRSFHPVIVAIVFVKAIGFGALSGIAALGVASIGFTGKLFAEAIEEISLKQVEAVRATGASFLNVIAYGVLPQVAGRFMGFTTYQLDSNLRNSTMVGIVGAGGIGGALFAAFQRFDYDFVCAMLLSIIVLIFAGELIAARVRAVFLERGRVDEE
jgi:phosphonate transport system permease protein